MKPRSHWLDRRRIRHYAGASLMIMSSFFFWRLATSNGVVDTSGNLLMSDFSAFWSASYLAATGQPEKAYDVAAIRVVEHSLMGLPEGVFGWFYPPPFLLVVLPFAYLGAWTSYWLFNGLTLVTFLVALRSIVRGSIPLLCVLSYPAVWINILHGQNGFLTASLAGIALMALRHRPWLSGFCAGFLFIKPHLALVFPLLFVVGSFWRVLGIAMLTGLCLLALSQSIFGMETMIAFLRTVDGTRGFLENGDLPWRKMPSLFASLRLLGVPMGWAYAGHALLAVLATGVSVWIWRARLPFHLKAASAMTTALMISPFLYDYDLVWLAFPIAWLCAAARTQGWLPGEREIFVAAWAYPLLSILVQAAVPVQLGPAVLCCLSWVCWRRARWLGSNSKAAWNPCSSAPGRGSKDRCSGHGCP